MLKFLLCLIVVSCFFLDQEILQNLVVKETEKRSAAMIQQLNSNNQDFESLKTTMSSLLEDDDVKENYKSDNEKETFTWLEKAVMHAFLELYREKEHECTTGLKRHHKL